MEINILLYPILIIVMYIFLFKSLKIIFSLFLFSTPFVAMSIININGISISFPILVGIFMLVKILLKIFIKKKIYKIKLNKFLVFFIYICIFSVLSPMYINDNFKITTNLGNYFIEYNNVEKIKPMISHLLYIIYCFSIYLGTVYVIGVEKITLENILKTIKYSFYVVLLFCISEIFFYKIGLIREFNYIFKMNNSVMVQGYGSFLRISGPNNEPSMLSIYLVMCLGIFYFTNSKKEILLAIILGVLSTSTSFLLGLCLYIVVILFRRKKLEYKQIIIILIGIIVVILLLSEFYPQMLRLFYTIFTKIKGEGVSGSDRKFNLLHHLKISISINPLLGIGYGVARSKDLLSTWLVNIGYIGVISFILGLIESTFNKRNKEKRFIGIVLMVVFIVEFISVPEPYFLYLWCLWGVLDSRIDLQF